MLELLNELIAISKIDDVQNFAGRFFTSRGIGSNSIIFSDNAVVKYQELVDKAYSSDKTISSGISIKQFESLLFREFVNRFYDRTNVSEADVAKFKSKIYEIPIRRYEIFREIYGIKIGDETTPCKIGPFVVMSYNLHKDSIFANVGEEERNVVAKYQPKYVIKVNVEARHYEKAVELADEMFAKFELVLRFMIGQFVDKFEVGVLNYSGLRKNGAIAVQSDGKVAGMFALSGPIELVQLDSVYFTLAESGHEELWRLLENTARTKMQDKILLSVEWIAQALGESSINSAFLKTIVALEILLTYDDSIIITPSIVSKITEGSALLLGKTLEERNVIDKKVKEFYKIRSIVVHKGEREIEKAKLIDAIIFVKRVIAKFLNHEKLRKITNSDNLRSFLQSHKYSSEAI